jgi:peptidoglycan/xylan/chitin deacetylase (PgdA/CDA1 family)
MAELDPLTRKIYSHGPERAVLLLMYHSTPRTDRVPESRYSLAASRFAEHIDFLDAAGWTSALVRDLANPGELPEKTVLITFDDGYQSNYKGAFIPLRERGMKATWYMVSGKIGGYADWKGPRGPENDLMSASELRELAKHGMEIGSHTVSHARLDRLDRATLREELVRSKTQLEDLLAEPVQSFAYPFGHFTETVVAAVGEAGYEFACTTQPGWYQRHESPLLIRRITIYAEDTLDRFARKIAFADNDVSWSKLARYYAGRMGARLAKSLTLRK